MQHPPNPSPLNQLKQQYLHDYSLNYSALFKTSWQLTKGAKTPILLAAILFFILLLFTTTLISLFRSPAILLLALLLDMLFIHPIIAGFWRLGIQRATGEKIKLATIFSGFTLNYIGNLFIINLWQSLLICITSLAVFILTSYFPSHPTSFLLGSLGIIAKLYIATIYFLAMPLTASQNILSWHALSLSRIAIHKHFIKFVGLILLQIMIAILVTLLSLGIALIWLIPWLVILQGRIFITIFLPDKLVTDANN